MARIKLVYLGGGSTRAAGTMASFMANGADFDGSEVVLVDLDEERLGLIRTLAERMARARGLDIAVTATTDRRAALGDCDAVLSSFRPGGFAARVHDERIPLEHGLIGQETQGAGGFFMALRAISVLKDVCAEMEQLCPDAWIFNYPNPVNIVAEAVTHHSPVRIVSLCEAYEAAACTVRVRVRSPDLIRTRAPIPSRFDRVPARRMRIQPPALPPSLRSRTAGPLLVLIATSRSPSPSTSA